MANQSIVWSSYQKLLFKDIQQGVGHTIIEARAGASKTTSIVESFKYLPRNKRTIALAFNKIIQKELRERAPSYVNEVLTFHSCGLRAIKQRFPSAEIDDYKVFNLVKELPECDQNYDLTVSICDAVAYCKYGLIDTPKGIDSLISNFGIDIGELERQEFIRIIIQTLGRDKTMTNKIDFNDMCWMHYVYNLDLGQYDYVFVDEVFDLNKSQMVMAKKLCKKDGGRIIVVGDPKQDIYKWRLSDGSIIDDLKKENTTKTLYLPISYRCPKKVIELVKPWVPDITCPENAKEGSIENISLDKLYEIAKPGCFILSRVNAPLIKIAMKFIRNGVKANIRGKDIGKNLTYLIKKSKKKQIKAFLTWLEKWKEDESEALLSRGIKTDNLMDRYECLVSLCEDLGTLEEVKAKIVEIFSEKDESNIIVLGSTHSAKGLERDNVFLLRWTYRAWFNNISNEVSEDVRDELNISYVAASRTKSNLYLVNKI